MATNEDNRRLIMEDELALVMTSMQSTCRHPVFLNKHNCESAYVSYGQAVILSDGSRCGVLASRAYQPGCSRKYPRGVTFLDVSNPSATITWRLADKTVVYVFVDTARVKLSDRILPSLKAAFEESTGHSNVRFVVHMFVPEPKVLPPNVNAVAEREYDYLLENSESMRGGARDYAVKMHGLCRWAVRDKGCDVTVLRSVNMFGPMATGLFMKKVRDIVSKTFSEKRVVIDESDHKLLISATLASDVVSAVFWAVYNAVPGHEFNVVSYRFSMATFKVRIFEAFAGELSLSDTCGPLKVRTWRCLNDLKFLGTRWRKFQKGRIDLSAAIKRTICYYKSKSFVYGNTISVYDGKLPQIKAVEMQILREIDRICEKHGIKYFLAGGTLLGAVRNNASIPWDDDFDIGFLRRDFDKFRKACDEELGDKFVHSCYYNGTNSHYMVDKIRMRNTYFSTRYSSIHAVEDGVFVDCLVYDATFENAFLASIHDKLCGVFGNLVQAYWREYRRDEVGSRLRWMLLVLVRVFPIGFYHTIYERLISLCRYRKAHPSHVIDSMGKHIGLGTIPASGLEDVRRIAYDDGFQAPIPIDPTAYLVYDYGRSYRPLPPYCKRMAPHHFARIDLGRFLADPNLKGPAFRDVDLRGELYEKET